MVHRFNKAHIYIFFSDQTKNPQESLIRSFRMKYDKGKRDQFTMFMTFLLMDFSRTSYCSQNHMLSFDTNMLVCFIH